MTGSTYKDRRATRPADDGRGRSGTTTDDRRRTGTTTENRARNDRAIDRP
ncbi:hypothetical protein PUR25_15215 [Streptomyces sp. JV181]|nr:hypothetical protein [Streptomyces sp. JV181]